MVPPNAWRGRERSAPPRRRAGRRTLARVNATDRTPADLLSSALAADPSRPLVTFYDDATGERVELSVATFANWVAKTSNLLQDGMSAEPGDRVALLLPAHWQTAVWLLACASVGVVADVEGDPAKADFVVAGPGRFEAGLACRGSVTRCRWRRWGGGSCRGRRRGTAITRWTCRASATGSRPTRPSILRRRR
ncbi:hypothetical protein GCM10020256_46910 [Streptomyces thermocoprophilus]